MSGSYFSGEEIIKLTDLPEDKYLERAPEYGARAFVVRGRRRTLVVWDEGNGWYTIITQLSRGPYDDLREKKIFTLSYFSIHSIFGSYGRPRVETVTHTHTEPLLDEPIPVSLPLYT